MAASTRLLSVKASGAQAGALAGNESLPQWFQYEFAASGSTPGTGPFPILIAPKACKILEMRLVHWSTAVTGSVNLSLFLNGTYDRAQALPVMPNLETLNPEHYWQPNMALAFGDKLEISLTFGGGMLAASVVHGLTLWFKLSL